MGLLLGYFLRLFVWNKAINGVKNNWKIAAQVFLGSTLLYALFSGAFGFLLVDAILVSLCLLHKHFLPHTE
jgi:hypothetical protein